MAWFLVTLRLCERIRTGTGWTKADEEAVDAHYRRLVDLHGKGTVLLAGRTDLEDAKTMGIVLYRAPDLDAARTLASADPAVIAGTMDSELAPFSFAIGDPDKDGQPTSSQ